MDSSTKGTVTPLASLFSEEEARKAAIYVEEKIGEKLGEMNRLQQFVDENANLIDLVRKLPDQLHHNVMASFHPFIIPSLQSKFVPFGKMAFFPGRLIHTNECLVGAFCYDFLKFMSLPVLLGENYYTDRTSKQTIDVLSRRDKTLQSQIRSLKAEIDDFQTEASFFSTTASEAAEGLVEIREEYVEEDSSATVLQPGVKEPSGLPEGETAEDEVKDDEFEKIMSRLNELEMKEQQEGEDGDDTGEKRDSPIESEEESERDMGKGIRGETDRILDIRKVASLSDYHLFLRNIFLTSIYVLLSPEDQSGGGIPQQNAGTWRDFQASSVVSRAKPKMNDVGQQKIESPIQTPEPKFGSNKAFTGSIVEHDHNLQTSTHGQMQSSGSQPSKPVSRFKAQRR
ncbi:unnamed protein product [Thlaspi arvense]|uniref:Uncharacterized protein n=1 Tax=Thlaspi arvense TaxID=13288 RepID=A0AAU9RF97_THLAR|nr:unnamed protein product [Thlaspi arvense]